MDSQRIEFFITGHRYAILPFLLADKDFDLSLMYCNKEFKFRPIRPDNILKINNQSDIGLSRASREDIDLVISRNFDKLRDKKIYFEEEDVECIINIGKVALSNFINSYCIKWTDNIIDKYKEVIDFKLLSQNLNLDIDETVIAKYENFWDWGALSANPKIFERNEKFMFSHPKTVWLSESKWKSYNYRKDEIVLNEICNVENVSGVGYSPCICTNPGIYWTIEKFNQYRNKIDFWLMASFSKIDTQVLVKNGDILNMNRPVNSASRKGINMNYSYTVYQNGWENWAENPNVFLDTEILEKVKNVKVNLVRYEGGANDEPSHFEMVTSVPKLFSGSKINLPLEEFIYNFEILPNNLLTQFYINPYIYHRTIKPALQSNPSLIVSLLECFEPEYLYDEPEIESASYVTRRKP